MGMDILDSVFGFLEDGDLQFPCSDESSGSGGIDFDGFDSEDNKEMSAAENKAFWETQIQLLQDALSRNSSSEKNIRQLIDTTMKTIKSKGVCCSCPNCVIKTECRTCVLKFIAQQLREKRYNSALCKSKWRKSPDIPSGEHNYVDVVMESKSSKRGPIRVLIELNFRGEFEMARGSKEYNNLVNCLPEVFVGKSDKLKSVLKIMCTAAKKCMEDNKMHMGPWRKHKYMQAKWLGTPERIGLDFDIPAAARAVADEVLDWQRPPVPKFRTSMLTFDLLCSTAVEVL